MMSEVLPAGYTGAHLDGRDGGERWHSFGKRSTPLRWGWT